jgi:TDG/mug DNA glycosylase family protein
VKTPILPDVLARNLNIIFCGTAAGTRSAELRAYYAHPGNKFWRTLHGVGLTPHRLQPAEYRELLKYGMGLTDLAKHRSGQDAVLRREDFNARALRKVITRYQPKVVAFTSKRAASEFFGGEVAYGLHSTTFGDTRFYVLTSPSGLASRFWLNGRHWQELADLTRKLPRTRQIGSRGNS